MSAKRKPKWDVPINPAVEDAPRCEHGVLAGEHCSVCGTLSDPPRTPVLTMRMILDALEVMEREGYKKPKFGGLGTVRFTDLLNAALRAATPPGPTIREVCDPSSYVAWVRFNGRTYVTCDSDGAGAFKVYRWRDRTVQP